MKIIVFAITMVISGNLIGQSAQLSTFEEMWIVGAEFNNFKVDINGFDEPILFTPKAINNIKSFEDLNKIIADTPFLSIRLAEGGDKFEKESKEHIGPVLNLSQKSKESNNLKGWGSFLVVFERDDEVVIGMPTKQPENLMQYFKENKLLISDKMGKFSNMTVKEIRIENGTYGIIK